MWLYAFLWKQEAAAILATTHGNNTHRMLTNRLPEKYHNYTMRTTAPRDPLCLTTEKRNNYFRHMSSAGNLIQIKEYA